MSFSFRNIFSPDDSEFDAAADPAVPGGFSAPGGIPLGRGNLSGESPASGPVQSFLVSELLPYIPKAIAAQSGIPMAKEVKVPLPVDGSLDVRLSELYQICPELFAAEITPLNDSTVTLPPRLGATPDTPKVATGPVLTKPSLTGAATADASANPFWSPVTTGSAPQSTVSPPAPEKPVSASVPADAAFSWPTSSPAKENPFSAEPAPAAKAFTPPASETPKLAGGFDAPAIPVSGKGFGSGSAVSEPAPSSGFLGYSEPAPVKDEAGDTEGSPRKNPFEGNEGFSTLFSKQAQADAAIPYPDKPAFGGGTSSGRSSGSEGVWGAMFNGTAFEEEEDEAAATGVAPFESIGNLLNQAKQSAPVADPAPAPAPSDNAFGGFGSAVSPSPAETPTGPDPDFAFAAGFTAFAPASAESLKKESSPLTVPSDPFTGFSGPAAEPPAPAPSMNPAPSAFAPFQSATMPAVDTPPAADPFTLPQGFEAPAPEAEPAPLPAPDAEPEAVEATASPAVSFTSPFTSFTPAQESPAVQASAEIVTTPVTEVAPVAESAPEVREEPVVETLPPVIEEEAPVVESHPAPAAVIPPAPSAPANAPANDDELRDLELRAIFSTSEVFTFSKVARKVVGLPGINSCSLSAPGKLVQASRREENRLGNEARDMVATLRSLAKLTGLPEARTFTLQTDRGIVSLFLEGDCCVTVHHDSNAFQPGVREKLILVARSLVKLRE
jgi:hypothetical protein